MVDAPIERRRGGLIASVRRFYADNPAEELTYALIQAKFGCTYRVALYVVETLAEEGLIERVHVIRLRARGIATEMVEEAK